MAKDLEKLFDSFTTNGNDIVNAITFPHENGQATAFGLTKREYFAAMAMQGLLSNHTKTNSPITASGAAVMFADELIKALNKK